MTIPPSQRPLPVGRARAADTFDSVLRHRWLAGDLTASNVALAERHIGVDEKQVRQWRENDKPLPFGAVYAMPRTVAEELLLRALNDVRDGCAPGARAVLVKLSEDVEALTRVRIADADVDEARGVLRAMKKAIEVQLAALGGGP